MNTLERIGCIFLVGFSIFIGFFSIRLGIGGLDLLGAGFLPFLAAILLFVMSLTVLTKGFLEKPEIEGQKNPLHLGEFKKPLMLVVGLIMYAILLKPLGYPITMFLFVFSMFVMMQPKKWKADLFIAALISIVSFVLFNVLLNVPLPFGILTFLY